MTWLLILGALTAYGTESNDALNQRLLGEATEQIAPASEPSGSTAVDASMVPSQQFAIEGLPAASEATAASPVSGLGTLYGMWPLGLGIVAAGGFLVARKKGLAVPGLSKGFAAPKVPMKVISRNTLGGNAAILLVDVEGADGVTRRLLLGTGGNATPTLVTDLGAAGEVHTPKTIEDAIPESFSMTMKQQMESVPQAPAPRASATPAPVQFAETQPARTEATPSTVYDELEYNPEGVEPGSDPLHTRLRRVHRHRATGSRAVISKSQKAVAQGGNWKVNQFSSTAQEGPTTEVDDQGITVKVRSSKSHLEAFAAKNVADEVASITPKAANTPAAPSRKRLDVSNAFEAELRRRVYDATPDERRARSEAAKALVDRMIQERMSQAQSA